MVRSLRICFFWDVTHAIASPRSCLCQFYWALKLYNSVLGLVWNKLWPLNCPVLSRQASCVCGYEAWNKNASALWPLCEFNCLSSPIREEIFWAWARCSTHQLPPNWSTYSRTTPTKWKVGRRRIFRASRANNRYTDHCPDQYCKSSVAFISGILFIHFILIKKFSLYICSKYAEKRLKRFFSITELINMEALVSAKEKSWLWDRKF